MNNPPTHPVYPISDLRDLLIKATDRYADRAALKSKVNGSYNSLTYAELHRNALWLATAFGEFGLQSGDHIAVLSENCTEWALTYLAAVSTGLVIVPIDKDLKRREVSHILNFSKPKLLVISGPHLDWISNERSELDYLERLIVIKKGDHEEELSFSKALEIGREALANGQEYFKKVSLNPEDLAAIIFTSGTTGTSKGVMLTHGNIASNIMAISQYVLIKKGVLLSVLPLHHTYECTAGFLVALYQGCTICHAESLRKIPDNLRETQATIMLGVPALFETFYRRIEKAIQEKGVRRFWFAQRIAAATEMFLGVNIRRQIFKKVHQKLGGHLRLLISGGAAINPHTAKGFRDLGVNFIQGYGMTEASPIISVNRLEHFKDAAVGVPLPGVEVEIINGEILVRASSVMRGYYLNEVDTREVLDDEWLRTGDMGYFDADGFLYINGRKKSVIVTPSGKNIYPEEVEAVLNESPYVLESLVWDGGENNPFKVTVQAIVVPDTDQLDRDFGPTGYDDAKIRDLIGREVRKYCRELASFKQVKKIMIRTEEFERTTTRKIKRYLYTGKPQKIVEG